MAQFEIKPMLLALLFSSDTPLTTKDIQRVITRYHDEQTDLLKDLDPQEDEIEPVADNVPTLLTGAQIHEALGDIRKDLEQQKTPYRLQETPNGYRLVVDKSYGTWVRLLRNEPKPIKLKPAALETLSIIAYRQLVTRAQIEKIRGVSADSAISKLLEHGLILVAGRADLPGRPTQYATTDKFLELAGLTSLDQLPAIEGLKSREIDAWLGQEDTQKELPL